MRRGIRRSTATAPEGRPSWCDGYTGSVMVPLLSVSTRVATTIVASPATTAHGNHAAVRDGGVTIALAGGASLGESMDIVGLSSVNAKSLPGNCFGRAATDDTRFAETAILLVREAYLP